MRWLILLLALIAAPAVCHAEESEAETHLAATLHADPASPVPGEAFQLWLQIRWAPDHFKRHAGQLFRQTLSLPVQVTWPWLDEPEGVVLRPVKAPAGDLGESFVLNGEVVRGLAVGPHDGRSDAMDRTWIQRWCIAEKAGPLTVPGVTLRYAYADEFEEDFLGERVAVDPRFVTVAGAPLAINVRPLPRSHRHFYGAIGRGVRVEGSIDRTRVRLGESLRYTLRVRGAQNLALFDTPAIAFEGFEIRGIDDDRETPVRTITYELAPLHARVKYVPYVLFAYFVPDEPHGGQYVVPGVRRQSLTVLPAEDAPTPEPASEAEPASSEEDPWWPHAVLGAITGAVAVWTLGRRRRRAAAPVVADARDEARIAAARQALEAHPDDRTLATYLAAQLDCSVPAVVGPELASRLEAAGVAPDLAVRTADAMTALVAARYGGAPAELDPELLVALQAALPSALTT